jgi:transcriptional regulator with PAS, ATPase and Fis domain
MVRESTFMERLNAGNVNKEASLNERISLLKDVSQTLSRALEAIEDLKIAGTIRFPNVAGGISFYDEVSRFEISLIQLALRYAQGSQRNAASLLGLKTTTLNSKIKTYNLDWRHLDD